MAVLFSESKTKQNLMRAFAGEGQARNRYTFAAEQARKEGKPAIADIFLYTADQERAHAGRYYELLKEASGTNIFIDGSYPVDETKTLVQLLRAAEHNEQEEADKALILNWIEKNDDAFLRDNVVAHMTASAWVVDKDRSKVLMVYHNIYHSWSWLGGHADGETDLLAVAIREVKEEAGISDVRPVSEEIFSLESLTVDGHVKKGRYVSSHLHLNVTYLLEADSEEQVSVKADENSGVAWFTPEEALKKSTEPWFVERVYAKLIEKTRSQSEAKTG